MWKYFALLFLLSACKAELPSSFKKADSELLNTWKKFKQAVKSNDKELLKSISVDSIRCLDCIDNTDEENKRIDSLDTASPDWDGKHYKEWIYIPFDKFYKEDLPLIFDNNVLNRLNDTTKVDLGLPHQYNSYYEFLVLTMDPDSLYEGFEGYQRVFQFCKTKEGYKFCGVSSVP